jgi:hypothetical protein
MVLTIASDTALSSMEWGNAIDFWKAVWLADGDKTKEQNAFQGLKTNVGVAAAEKILLNYKPVNIEQLPLAPFKKNEITLSVSFVIFPLDSSIVSNENSWTKPPKVTLLPEHFVVMGYKNQQQVFIKTGKRLPSLLEVGIDPSLPKNEQISLEKGNLRLNKNLQWMTDFDKALADGMAIKIFENDLSSGNIKDGFDKVLVVGLKLGIDPTTAKKQLQQLLENHFFSKRGYFYPVHSVS